MHKKNVKHAAILNLFDTLKVLGLYEDLSKLKEPFENILQSNNELFVKNTYDLNARLPTFAATLNNHYPEVIGIIDDFRDFFIFSPTILCSGL